MYVWPTESHRGPHLEGPGFWFNAAVVILKFLIIFDQGALSSTNYVACPASQTVRLRITWWMQINQISTVSELSLRPKILNQHFNKHPINSFTKFAKPENHRGRESSY